MLFCSILHPESGRSSELITKHSPDAIDPTLQSSLLDNIQEIKSLDMLEFFLEEFKQSISHRLHLFGDEVILIMRGKVKGKQKRENG